MPPTDPAVTAPIVPAALPATPVAAASAPEPAAAKPRNKLGNYEIIEAVGRGGMGVVYKARHTPTGRFVALKILPRSFASDDGYVGRFRREAVAASKLIHPNIVLVYESGVADGLHYIAFEYVDGPTLDKMIRQEGRLAEAETIEIGISVARALHHAHSKGVLHRDIKPGNILVTRGGEVKLTDFGMAKFQSTALSFQTTVGRVFGTPAFLSPEQANGAAEVDHRADLYSLGCVIYNMAAGQPPFSGDNPFVVIDLHRFAEPRPIRALNTQISRALETLVARAMAKNPAHRYQSAQEVIVDLEMIRQALRAPRTVRGGLADIVRALDEINLVDRRIREAHTAAAAPGWRARCTAAFLARPMVWFGAAAATLAAGIVLALWLGYCWGRSSGVD